MKEAPIGIIWRFGRNDYQISLFSPSKEEEDYLNKVMESTEYRCSCVRGEKTLSIKDANIDYWEDVWVKEEIDAERKKLADKLYDLGFKKTDVLYDDQADKQLTRKQIADALSNPRDAAYTLETFLQFCDGTQEPEDHDKFFKAAMDIVHFMEDYLKGEN